MDALKSQAAYGNVASKYSKKRGRDDGAGHGGEQWFFFLFVVMV